MIALFAGLSVLVSVVAQSAAAAFSKRFWLGWAIIALCVLLPVVLPILDWLASIPSDALARALSSAQVVEGLALAICFEAFVGAYLLWHSTSTESLFRDAALLMPLPSTVAGPLALAQLSMARGPRIDLELLGWAAIASSVVFIASIALLARLIRHKAPDFLLEMCLLLRLIAVLSAAAMISALHNRPAPTLEFEPIGIAIVLILCTVLIGFGYFRKLDT